MGCANPIFSKAWHDAALGPRIYAAPHIGKHGLVLHRRGRSSNGAERLLMANNPDDLPEDWLVGQFALPPNLRGDLEGQIRNIRSRRAAAEVMSRLLGSAHKGQVPDSERARGPLVMGIVNVTPDSFHDGGRHDETAAAISHAHRLIKDGADILDIGGESTRPGATPPTLELELDRTIPVIEALKGAGRPLSIDTRRAAVMEQAVAAGAQIINDVSALEDDPEALSCAAHLAKTQGVHICLMHKQGQPQTMQDQPTYQVASLDVYDYLEARLTACLDAGCPHERIWLDPGIGFGKTLDHNLDILAHLSLYHGLGCPLLVGLSRKGLISHIMERQFTEQQNSTPTPTEQRLPGSLAGALQCAHHGAQIIRVHDVAETCQALTVWEAIQQASEDWL